MLRRISKENVRGMIAYGASPAFGVLSGPVLAHALGPHGRGQFSAAMEPLTVAGAIATIGIPSAVTYFTARGYGRRETLRRGLRAALIPTSITFLFMVWYSGKVAETQGMPRWILIYAWSFIFVSAVVQIRRGSWQGIAAWRRLDLERLLFGSLRFVAVASVALVGLTSSSPYIVAALAAFVLASVVLWFPKSRSVSSPAVSPLRGRPFITYSLTASIGTITVVANNRIDQVLMPAQVGSSEVGYYAVAVTIAEVPLVLGALASRNALQLASSGRSLREVISELWIYFAAVIAAALVLAAFAGIYVPFLFGSDFSPSVNPVRVLAAGSAGAVVTLISTAYLSGVGRPGLSSLIPVCGFVVTAIAFSTAWGSIGAMEAAIIATLGQVASLITAIFVVWRVESRRSRRTDFSSPRGHAR